LSEKVDNEAIGLIGFPAWDALKELIDKRVKMLEQLFTINSETDTPESIGYRYMALQNVIQHLNSIKEFPEHLLQAKKLHEEIRAGQRGKSRGL
jgi:hypothetical protein